MPPRILRQHHPGIRRMVDLIDSWHVNLFRGDHVIADTRLLIRFDVFDPFDPMCFQWSLPPFGRICARRIQTPSFDFPQGINRSAISPIPTHIKSCQKFGSIRPPIQSAVYQTNATANEQVMTRVSRYFPMFAKCLRRSAFNISILVPILSAATLVAYCVPFQCTTRK